MKYCLLFILLIGSIVSSSGSQLQDNNSSDLTSNAESDSIIAIDTTSSLLSTDSIEKGYNMMMYLYRLQIDQMEQTHFRDRRIIFILGILIIVLVIITISLTSRRSLFISFPYYRQKKGFQPGLVCLQMVHKYYYGKKIPYKKLLKLLPSESDPNSLNMDDLTSVAEKSGFDVKVVKSDIKQLYRDLQLPVILYLPNHMSVLYAHKSEYFYLADPYYGYLKLKLYYFASSWFVDDKSMKGIAVQIYPLNPVKKSIKRKLDREKFSGLTAMDKKTGKNYTCELDLPADKNDKK